MVRYKDIIICSIVRNAEHGLKNNIPVLKKLCSYFNGYKVFVYENDSIDGTKQLLKDWALSDPNNVFISLNNVNSSLVIPSQKETGKVNCFFSAKRIERMACLRNYYMDYVEQHGWEADYFMVVDLDVALLNLDAILNSFEDRTEWDAVTAFGYSLSPKLRRRYHDTYALTEYGDENEPQTEHKIKELAVKYGKMKKTDDWVRVFSAYGGLAIYRFEAIKGLKYYAQPNNDRNVEVRCEHFSVYKQMAVRGFDRVYINPRMTLKYQNLSWKIISNHIKRKL